MTGRSSLLLAASLVATSVLAAAQALALLVICGDDPRTEAFLAAYALYLPIAVLGSSLRATVSAIVAQVPIAERAQSSCDIVSRCILLGAIVTGAMLVASPLLAIAIGSGLTANVRDVTLVALMLLLPAAFLHVVAAALSGALGAQRQFGFSASTYVATGALSLALSIGLLSAIGPVGAAIGVLAGTVVLAGAHLRRARALGIRVRLRSGALRERAQWHVVAAVFSGAALGFALQANLAVSLAALAGAPGSITAYSYAFFMATMILSLSSLPLALVTLPDLVGEVQARGHAAVADHLARFAPYAFAVVLPLVAGFLGFGRAAIAAVVEPFVDVATAQLMFEIATTLVLMTLPAALFYLASAASLPAATARERVIAAAATIALHAASVAVVWGDAQAVAWAHAVAMTLSTAVLLAQVLRRHAVAAVAHVMRGVAPIALAALPILGIGLVAGSAASPVTTVIGAAAAATIYVLALRWLAPTVIAPFATLLRRPVIA